MGEIEFRGVGGTFPSGGVRADDGRDGESFLAAFTIESTISS